MMLSLLHLLVGAVFLSCTSTWAQAACIQGSCEEGWCTLGESASLRCVKIFKVNQTWCGACSACAAHGSQLLTIKSAEEQAAVESAFPGTPAFHIGLYRLDAQSTWAWQGGATVDFTLADWGAPQDSEHCRSFDVDRWNHGSCGEGHHFACETALEPAACPAVEPCPTSSSTGSSSSPDGTYVRRSLPNAAHERRAVELMAMVLPALLGYVAWFM
mmetsp:Transcript_6166/g.10731  ORF Transcript_6166/g.10731 Transcript_6166/m.10731 type:complete len:215 (-) Transcript_6166:78-722(-)